MRVPGPGGGNEEQRLLILKNFHKFGKVDLFLQKQDKIHLVRAAVSAKQILFFSASHPGIGVALDRKSTRLNSSHAL